MYGSGPSGDPALSGNTAPTTGQGSHLSSSNAAGNDPTSSSTEPPLSRYGESNPVGNDPNPISSKESPLNPGYGSGSTAGKDPLSSKEPPSATGYNNTTTNTGPRDNINQPTGYGDTGADINDPYSSSRTQGTPDDAATTASIKSGIPGLTQSRSLTGSSGTHDTLDTNKPLPSEPDAGLLGTSSSTNTGLHSSSLANKADPRVDSTPESKGLGSNFGDETGLAGKDLPIHGGRK